MTQPHADESTSDYYDREAGRYDETRGGRDRARAAAAAIVELAPGRGGPTRGRCLDVAGGTGVVAAELAARGWDVTVADLSTGMLRVAAERLPGRVVRALADRLPVADGVVDLVTVVWFLHLVPADLVATVVADAARVLAPDGRLVVTVDKRRAHDPTATDLSDDAARVAALASGVGLELAGESTFSGRSVWGSATAGDPVFRLAAYRRG